MEASVDTIAAIATPPGRGGVGIIRISGSQVKNLTFAILKKDLSPRRATFSTFFDKDGSTLDQGIAVYFPAPHSYTGEDILELQGHGNNILLDLILTRIQALGARLAKPGEFTERAFLNNKIDLIQAEAIADLIESSTTQSIRCAQRSLQGQFSDKIKELVDDLINLRTYVEAAIDFTDEEIDFLSEGLVEEKISTIKEKIEHVLTTAKQGRLLQDGISIVIAGKPNAGKSSLLNALTGDNTAIVTEIAGTTRDVIREKINLDGMPLHIIDTAGLRESEDPVEKEGIERAKREINKTDHILLIIDADDPEHESLFPSLPNDVQLTKIFNKIDLLNIKPKVIVSGHVKEIYLSAKTGLGINLLIDHLKACAGFTESADSLFTARRRHIEALTKAKLNIKEALFHTQNTKAPELIAEELKLAQDNLSEITGKFCSDDLLGSIFSSFCIGK